MRRAWSLFGLSLAAGLAALTSASVAAAQAPPGTGTDMEIDPDAKPAEPPPPEPPKEPELPPADPGAWGVGGKEEEGKYAPTGKTGALKKDEASEDNDPPNALPPPGQLAVDTVIGFGDMHVATNDSDVTTLTVVSFVGSLQYRFGEVWTVGVRFPFSTGSTKGPGGEADDFSTFALGNLEIGVRPSFAITKRIRLPIGVGFYVPLASGDYFADPLDRGSLAQATVNQAAASSRGWEENALFASKRIGFVPSVGLTYDKKAVHAAFGTKLEIMGRTGGLDPTSAAAGELHDPNTNWVTQLSFFYDFLDGKLTPGLRLWTAVNTVPITQGTSRNYSGAQFVLEPDVLGRLPLDQKGDFALAGGLGFILPLGGHLGGADGGSGAKGLRLKVALQF